MCSLIFECVDFFFPSGFMTYEDVSMQKVTSVAHTIEEGDERRKKKQITLAV